MRRVLLLERFMSHVSKGDGSKSCWLWLANKDKDGYGKINIDRKTKRTHIVSYELFIGEIPKNEWVLHTCDNPSCVNPDHLWLGDNSANMQDMLSKGRGNKASGDRHYSKMHPEKVAKGEQCHLAKLTAEQVLELRREYAENNVSQKMLADKYRLSPVTVHKIVKYKSWKHIQIKELFDVKKKNV